MHRHKHTLWRPLPWTQQGLRTTLHLHTKKPLGCASAQVPQGAQGTETGSVSVAALGSHGSPRPRLAPARGNCSAPRGAALDSSGSPSPPPQRGPSTRPPHPAGWFCSWTLCAGLLPASSVWCLPLHVASERPSHTAHVVSTEQIGHLAEQGGHLLGDTPCRCSWPEGLLQSCLLGATGQLRLALRGRGRLRGLSGNTDSSSVCQSQAPGN